MVVVKDLDAAAENWKRLGFTISPRGTHSAHMGTGNYTIMLGEDYIELLGVLTATEHNAPAAAFSPMAAASSGSRSRRRIRPRARKKSAPGAIERSGRPISSGR